MLNREIEFVLSFDGAKRRTTAYDGILQVIHHSSHHRGQIIVQLKNKINELPLITYVAFASTRI